MRDEDLDYARGLALVTAGGGVPDAVIRSAALLAPSTEAPALFGPGERERDGWTVDAAGEVWTPPDSERPYQPVRSGLAEADVASGEPSTVVPSSSRPTQTVNAGEQRAAAAQLSDSELAQMLLESERWERWCSDDQVWRWRWDRRVLYIGRAIQGG
jgi:hypothetical protein